MKVIAEVYFVTVLILVLGFAWRVEAAPLNGDTPSTPVVTEAPPPPVETEAPTPVPTRRNPFPPVETQAPPVVVTEQPTPVENVPPAVPDPQPPEEKERSPKDSAPQELPKTGFMEDLGSWIVVAMACMVIFIIARFIRNQLS